MALTEKLTNIGNAIREKTGKTDLLTLDEMPTEIQGISGGGEEYFTDEDLTFSDRLISYLFIGPLDAKILEKEKNRLKFNNISYGSNLFNSVGQLDLSSLVFNCAPTINITMLFHYSSCIALPKLNCVGSAVSSSTIQYPFGNCYYLRSLPEGFEDLDFSAWNNSTSWCDSFFENCYSLREISPSLVKKIYTKSNSMSLRGTYANCASLNKLVGFPSPDAVFSSNAFSSNPFALLFRVSDIIFNTDNGTPFTRQWTNQTIDLSNYIGYGNGRYLARILSYNSGITTDKEVKDDDTYAALKNDPDWYTVNLAYSRYNHDSAVNTINSLPDTSAYLATAGGTNTIKFRGAAGEKTDGGAINTLTEEEIAVATAKGWTVTLV